MLLGDYVSLSTTEKIHFRNLMRYALPGFDPPARRTIVRYVKLLGVELTTSIARDLGTMSVDPDILFWFGMTLDLGANRSKKGGLMAVTLHWLDRDCNLCDMTIGCSPLKAGHNAQYIASEITAICNKLKISTARIAAVTTDRGPT